MTPKTPKSKKPKKPKKKVEVDEARQTAGKPEEAFTLDGPDGMEPLAEELGEEFVENVTGADDAASEHREARLSEEDGGPFIVSPAGTEFADDTDEAEPTATSHP